MKTAAAALRHEARTEGVVCRKAISKRGTLLHVGFWGLVDRFEVDACRELSSPIRIDMKRTMRHKAQCTAHSVYLVQYAVFNHWGLITVQRLVLLGHINYQGSPQLLETRIALL